MTPMGRRSFPRLNVGADVGGHLDHFGTQNHSGPVLGVPAIHLVADSMDGIDVSAAGLQEDGQPAQTVFDQVASRTWKVGGDHRRAGSHGHGVAAVAETGGDGPALEVVDSEDADSRIDGYAGILPQHVPAVGTRLPPVDADIGFTPTGPDPSRLQRPVGFHGGFHQPVEEPFLVGTFEFSVALASRAGNRGGPDRCGYG